MYLHHLIKLGKNTKKEKWLGVGLGWLILKCALELI